MNRQSRLQSAQRWLIALEKDKKFSGKNTVRRYAKWYGVDLLCAIKEVRLLGIIVEDEYEELVRRSIADRLRMKRLKKESSIYAENVVWDDSICYDSQFPSEDDGIMSFDRGFTHGKEQGDDDLPF